MFLFTLLKNEGYSFSVVHVNYHFRKESDEEEQQLRECCENNNIDLFVLNNKEVVKSNLEEKAREIRYAFFNKYKKTKDKAKNIINVVEFVILKCLIIL